MRPKKSYSSCPLIVEIKAEVTIWTLDECRQFRQQIGWKEKVVSWKILISRLLFGGKVIILTGLADGRDAVFQFGSRGSKVLGRSIADLARPVGSGDGPPGNHFFIGENAD